jgi:hypothetical protein
VADKDELEALQKRLQDINDKLADLSGKLSTMSPEDVQDAEGDIKRLKRQLIHALPAVLGIPFSRWYEPLSSIDEDLARVLGFTVKPAHESEGYWGEYWREMVQRNIDDAHDRKKELEETIKKRLEALKHE